MRLENRFNKMRTLSGLMTIIYIWIESWMTSCKTQSFEMSLQVNNPVKTTFQLLWTKNIFARAVIDFELTCAAASLFLSNSGLPSAY